MLLRPEYLRPYDHWIGQLALILVGVLFAAGFWLLQRMSRFTAPASLLAPPSSEVR
jgi:hypothetical protein